jgi:pseudouridine-5'-phosphate glycosidase
MAPQSPFDVSDEIQVALGLDAPVVAIESAVVSHGLPRPANLQAAHAMISAVRRAGAVPAMVAVLDGTIRVGLSDEDLLRLAELASVKIARRDLPVAVGRKATGGTTVSATLAVAHAIGVHVQATGGIGGVHLSPRGLSTWDVSADLDELGRRPLVVVSSGTKAICDPAATLEALDTRGVTVVGFRTSRFPLFYLTDSGFPVPWEVASAVDIAAIYRAKQHLGDMTALLVANPPPADAALPVSLVRGAVEEAVARAEAEGIRGAGLTPYLLREVDARTGGRAVQSNLAVLESNALLAAQVALALTEERLPT